MAGISLDVLIIVADVILFLGSLAVMVTVTHRAMMREARAQEAREAAGVAVAEVAPAAAPASAAARRSAVA